MNITIKHDANKQAFYTNVQNQLCELNYNKIDNGVLELYRTYVPENLRHQGIAAQITEHALAFARHHHYLVIPSCPYIKDYLDNHPEFADVIKTCHR